MYPHVDIPVSPTAKRSGLLYKTLNGCIHLKYPDKSKVHIYLCDDTNRPEMRQLAEQMGVGYFGLSDNTHAKAGNLNHALSKTDSPLVVTLDADMIPTSEFCWRRCPFFFLPKMIQRKRRLAQACEDEIDKRKENRICANTSKLLQCRFVPI